MRYLVLCALVLLACSKGNEPPRRESSAPPVRDVTYGFAKPLYEENTLVACLETKSTSRSDLPPPDAPDGSITQPCSAFGKRVLATCDLGWRRMLYYVPFEDDLESRDCIADGGRWQVDEKEMARAEREQRAKKAIKLADEIKRKYGTP